MAATTLKSGLEEVERDDDKQLPFLLTKVEIKLLGIAGIGFLLDAYDLFIINQIATMLQYRLYDGHSLPANLEGYVKAGANIGAVVGQLGFGYLAAALGRKAIYGKELMIMIVATILTLATPTGKLSPDDCLIYLGAMRIFLGIGIGGDYPMASTIMTDRAVIRKRLLIHLQQPGLGLACRFAGYDYRAPRIPHADRQARRGHQGRRRAARVAALQAQENRELNDIADLKLRQRKEDAEREGVPEVAAAKKDEPDADDGQEIKVVEAPSGSGDSSEQASVREQPIIEKHDAPKMAHFCGASLVIILRCPGLRYGARATRAPLCARGMDTAHRARDILPFPVVFAIPDREPPEIGTDCAVIRKRSALLSHSFSNRGWGSLVWSLVQMIVLLAYRTPIDNRGEVTTGDGGSR